MNYSERIKELEKQAALNEVTQQGITHDPKNIHWARLRHEMFSIANQMMQLNREQANHCRVHAKEQFHKCMDEKANYANKNVHCMDVRWTELNKCLDA